jgi:hypothetical protein
MANMTPWLADPETPIAEARGDAVAWVAGGLIWGAVTALAVGTPVGVVFGGTLALVLRRALRLMVAF